jgi:hypothetical protein
MGFGHVFKALSIEGFINRAGNFKQMRVCKLQKGLDLPAFFY